MKKIIAAVLFAFVTAGMAFGQQLGAPTAFQQILNAMPAIPIAGNNLKFEFGGGAWVARVNGENFMAGTVETLDINGGSLLSLKQTHVWAGAAGRAASGLLGGALGGAVSRAANTWVATPGPEIALDYNTSGPRATLSVASEARIAEARASGVRASGASPAVGASSTAGIRAAEAAIAAANAAMETRAAETRLAEALVTAEARAVETREAERRAAAARSAANPNATDVRLAEARAAEARAAEALAIAEARMAEARAIEAREAETRVAEAPSAEALAAEQPGQTYTVQPASAWSGGDSGDLRNKRVFLGGALGYGVYEYEYAYYFNGNYYWDDDSGSLWGICGLADIAITNWFGVEALVGFWFGDDTVPMLVLSAKLGYRWPRVELFAEAGYAIGEAFTLGASLGFKAGPGVIFTKLAGTSVLPSSAYYPYLYWLVGYKVGVGDRRN